MKSSTKNDNTGKIYLKSYSKNAKRISRASDMFDFITGVEIDPSVATSGRTITTRGNAKKTKQITSENLLSVISEKEVNSSPYEDSSTFMIFKENLKKKKANYKKNDSFSPKKVENKKKRKKNAGIRESESFGKKPLKAQSKKRVKKNTNSRENDNNKNGDVNKVHELFIENNEKKSLDHRSMKKMKSKKSLLEVQNIQAFSERNTQKQNLFSIKESENIMCTARDLEDSIEIAREKADSSHCALPYKFRSRVLFRHEPERKSSSEDSLSTGFGSFEDSAAFTMSDNKYNRKSVLHPSESSKYTYTYVSTYSHGTSGHSLTKSGNSPFVRMKRCLQLNSTTQPEKDNIGEVAFPNCLSPIYPSIETTPLKNASKLSALIPRKDKKYMSGNKEKTAKKTPKCSTMLFSPRSVDDSLGFPVSLTAVEVVDTRICSNSSREDCDKDTNGIKTPCTKEIVQPSLFKKQKLASLMFHLDENGNKMQDHLEAGNEKLNFSIDSKIQRTGGKERKDACSAVALESLTVMNDAPMNTVQTPVICMESTALQKSFKVLKSLKRKASRCFSSNQKDSKCPSSIQINNNQYVDIQSLAQPREELMQSPPDCLSVSYKSFVSNSPDYNEKIFDAYKDTKAVNGNEWYGEFEICCVNRLCMSVNNSSGKEQS